jgi:hypothetical protein
MPAKSKFKVWFKRMGIVGFMFFLIKGVIWLAIFLGAGKLLGI